MFVGLLAISLCGCYNNWPSLDNASDAITCDMDITALDKLATRFQANGTYDDISKTYGISYADDAIGIVFNDKGQIATIAKTRSKISMAGLIRQQGDIIIVKRCIKQ